MAARIDDRFMSAEHDGRVIATARYSSHAAADGHGAWIVSVGPAACSPATRRSRPWSSRSGSRPVMAIVTRSSSAGARSWGCDGPAHQDHDGAGGGGRGPRRRGDLVPARLRAGALARRVRVTARLLPFTVDGLIWAASMVVLDASRRGQPVRGWPPGAWVPGSWPRSVPTWHTVWATARSVRWSAPGLPGAGWFIRAADDAHPHWAWLANRWGRARTGTSQDHRQRKTRQWNCRLRQAWSRRFAHGTRRARVSALLPENSTSPPKGQAHSRSGRMTLRTAVELSHDTSLQTLSSVHSLSAVGAVYSGLDTHRRGCADLFCRWFVVPIAREQIPDAANAANWSDLGGDGTLYEEFRVVDAMKRMFSRGGTLMVLWSLGRRTGLLPRANALACPLMAGT